MNKNNQHLTELILILFFLSSCNKPTDNNALDVNRNQVSQKERAYAQEADGEHDGGEEIREIHLSTSKFANLGIKVDALPVRSLSGNVKVNGKLALFPQHRATVTAILGANVTAINVIESERVKKGQLLAYLSHPNLTNLQAAYIRAYSQMQFLEKEYKREKKLYDEGVSSGKSYQQAYTNFLAKKGEVAGFEAQLIQLNIDARKTRTGIMLQNVPVVSPIDGYIEKVLVQTGQFVDPNATLFMIMNLDHIHADFMVFEKDVSEVKEGQRVTFRVESIPGKTLSAQIFAVGKNFEQAPRAVHVHAKIEQKEDLLIPGMYTYGEIHTGSSLVNALPEDAIVMEEGKSYIYMAQAQQEDGKTEWTFKPVEVITGISDDGWVEIKPVESLPENVQVAWNNAYYLIAEMKKGETSHEH